MPVFLYRSEDTPCHMLFSAEYSVIREQQNKPWTAPVHKTLRKTHSHSEWSAHDAKNAQS